MSEAQYHCLEKNLPGTTSNESSNNSQKSIAFLSITLDLAGSDMSHNYDLL